MKKLSFLSTFFAFSFILMATDAQAGQSLGGVITNTLDSFSTTPGLLTGFSYLCGLILGFMGIMKVKDHVESPNQVTIWEPCKRFLAGGAFFALPQVMKAAIDTFTDGAGGTAEVLEGSNYNTGAVSGGGLDAMLVALMQDIFQPMQFIISGFAWLAGIVLIIIGISRLIKSEQEGPRGPLGFGTIMCFLVGGVLLSINSILGSAVNSIFNIRALNFAQLAYTDGMDAAGVGHAEAVIGAIMAFVAIVGFISFVRGFFIIRQVSEGNSQASMMAAVTHIIGGAIAVNLGAMIEAVQETLGIENFGLMFG